MGVDNFFLDLVFADNSNIFQWVVIILTFIIGFLEIVKQLFDEKNSPQKKNFYKFIYLIFTIGIVFSSVQILNIISNQNKIMNNFSNETIKKTYFASKTISTYLINEKSEYTALGILSAPVILIILLITLYYILCIGGEKIKIINNDGIISVISVIITLVFFALLLNYQQYSY